MMRTRGTKLILPAAVALLAIGPVRAAGAEIPHGEESRSRGARLAAGDSTYAERADVFVRRYVGMDVFTGAVLVARGDEVLFRRAYGLADREAGVRNSPSTKFRVASISKAFTAAAVARLVLEGELSWETPLSRFHPDFPRADSITIRQLVEHRSGVAHLNDLPWYGDLSRRPVSVEELVDRLAEEPLDFPPGTDSNYSNGGYLLLADILQRVSGRSYGEVLQREVFGPAGMLHSGHESGREVVPGLAEGYTIGPEGGFVHPTVLNMDVKIGGGSAYTTVDDLFRWSRAMRRGELLPHALQDSLWGTGESVTGRERRIHGGRAPGFTAFYQHFPEADVTTVVLSNHYARLNEELSDGLAGLYFDEDYDNRLQTILHRPDRFTAVSISDSVAKTFAGQYVHPFGFEFDIEVRGGRLYYVQPDRDRRHPLIPTSDSTVVDRWQWARITRRGDGSLVWHWLDYLDQDWEIETR